MSGMGSRYDRTGSLWSYGRHGGPRDDDRRFTTQPRPLRNVGAAARERNERDRVSTDVCVRGLAEIGRAHV